MKSNKETFHNERPNEPQYWRLYSWLLETIRNFLDYANPDRNDTNIIRTFHRKQKSTHWCGLLPAKQSTNIKVTFDAPFFQARARKILKSAYNNRGLSVIYKIYYVNTRKGDENHS